MSSRLIRYANETRTGAPVNGGEHTHTIADVRLRRTTSIQRYHLRTKRELALGAKTGPLVGSFWRLIRSLRGAGRPAVFTQIAYFSGK